MGEYMIGLVGEGSYQRAIRRTARGHVVRLIHEHDNRHDPQAVKAITAMGETIGYLPRDHWARKIVISGSPEHLAVVAEVTGGTRNKPSRGVVLVLFTADEARAMMDRAKSRRTNVFARIFARLFGTGR
jgi:HIRAN domain